MFKNNQNEVTQRKTVTDIWWVLHVYPTLNKLSVPELQGDRWIKPPLTK